MLREDGSRISRIPLQSLGCMDGLGPTTSRNEVRVAGIAILGGQSEESEEMVSRFQIENEISLAQESQQVRPDLGGQALCQERIPNFSYCAILSDREDLEQSELRNATQRLDCSLSVVC